MFFGGVEGSVRLEPADLVGDEMMEATFGSAYDRLVALKAEYDPVTLFGGNVDPSGGLDADGPERSNV